MRKQTKLVAVLSAAALLAIGASMTSFAAAGWVQEGEDWVYLNKEGDRDANVWRRSGDNYYWLDENGVMARNALVVDDTVNATYCVDENGVRVVNAWREVPNDDGAQVGSQDTDDTPAVLYYYFGASGKAYVGGDRKVREIDGKYYMFNEAGQMLSGWQSGKDDELYYFGTEREGFAYTDWQHLEPRDSLNSEDYDDLEWFYFGTNGKASKNKSQYINGKYYHFDENGVMDDDWYDNGTGAPTAASGAQAFATLYGTKTGWVYTGDADLPEDQRYDNDSMHWYYLVNVNGGGKVARSIPYNYQKADMTAESGDAKGKVGDATADKPIGFARAMVIKNKTYLFNSNGKMLTGFVVIEDPENKNIKAKYDDVAPKNITNEKGTYDNVQYLKDGTYKYVAWNKIGQTKETPNRKLVKQFMGADKPFGYVYKVINSRVIKVDDENKPEDQWVKLGQPVAGGRNLVNGLYYFSTAGGSVTGQMQMGRTAITVDGETFYYYFSKNNTFPGYAYTNAIVDGYLYGADGKCVVADAGNSYAVYQLTEDVQVLKNDAETYYIPKTYRVVVSRTGKVKTSGTVVIDGIKYTIGSKEEKGTTPTGTEYKTIPWVVTSENYVD